MQPISVGGRREAVWYANSLCTDSSNHLAERGVLAADYGNVAHPNGLERQNESYGLHNRRALDKSGVVVGHGATITAPAAPVCAEVYLAWELSRARGP
jgi:hypothetical protein